MLKIGDFSKLSRISVRMLRYYDDAGLLKPKLTDKFTGYRYYGEDQLITAGRIASLRDMGFGIGEISAMSESGMDEEKMDGFLKVKEAELLSLEQDTLRSLRLLKTARARLKEEAFMNYNVTLKTLPERYAATVRMTIPTYDEEGMVWSVMMSETAGMKIEPADPCLCSVEFLDGEYMETNPLIEAQKTVKGKYADTEHVKFKPLPEVTFASTVHKGSYDGISAANAAVAEWINENGYEFISPAFNIYYISPHESNNPEDFVTEICYPVRKAK